MTVRVPSPFGSAKDRNTLSGKSRTEDSNEKSSKKNKILCPAQATKAKPGILPVNIKKRRKKPGNNPKNVSERTKGQLVKIFTKFPSKEVQSCTCVI